MLLFIEYSAVGENFPVAEVMQDFKAPRMQARRLVAEPEDFPVKIEKEMRFRNLFFPIYFPEAVCTCNQDSAEPSQNLALGLSFHSIGVRHSSRLRISLLRSTKNCGTHLSWMAIASFPSFRGPLQSVSQRAAYRHIQERWRGNRGCRSRSLFVDFA